MKPRVFVVQSIPEEALRMLQEVAQVDVFTAERMISRDELIARVKRCDYVYTLGDTTIDAEILDANPQLKGIAAMTMVPNVIDVAAMTARKIPLTNIPHVIPKTTCDLTMAHVLGLACRLVEADRFTRHGRFHQEQSMTFLWHSLPGKIAGLIGLGRIGEELVKRLRAFEMPVIYTKRERLALTREEELAIEWVPDKDAVLRQADFVIIMASYNPSTHLMIGAREFSLMKRTAFFINTARGRIVDEKALIDALRNGTIAGAGLDVYWTEPPVGEPAPSSELFKLDTVILTPHIGSATWESRREMATLAAINMIAMIKGERPPNIYNPEIYGH
jgi:glyoxylate reductase